MKKSDILVLLYDIFSANEKIRTAYANYPFYNSIAITCKGSWLLDIVDMKNGNISLIESDRGRLIETEIQLSNPKAFSMIDDIIKRKIENIRWLI